jgi:conjugal transfer pilus assembly protein TraW
MQARLFQMQQDGSLKAESNKIKEKILNNVKTPQAVTGIKHTEIERTFKYDPTIELTRDLADHKGQIFARKGDRFNPLDVIMLSKPLLFIDGDDETHIKWAISKIKDESIRGHASCKIILVKGSPLELQASVALGKNRDIYFDQHGILTTKLGIQHVPAIVFQGAIEDRASEKVLTIIEEKAAEKTKASVGGQKPIKESYA